MFKRQLCHACKKCSVISVCNGPTVSPVYRKCSVFSLVCNGSTVSPGMSTEMQHDQCAKVRPSALSCQHSMQFDQCLQWFNHHCCHVYRKCSVPSVCKGSTVSTIVSTDKAVYSVSAKDQQPICSHLQQSPCCMTLNRCDDVEHLVNHSRSQLINASCAYT